MSPREELIHSNEEWLAALRGKLGRERQYQAHNALAGYLYTVAYNYLVMRQNDLSVLATFHPQDLAALAQEFVQDVLERLAFAEHRLLDQFQGTGQFTTWAAVIVRRHIAKELHKKRWTQRTRLDEDLAEQEPIAVYPMRTSPRTDPLLTVWLHQIESRLQTCLQALTTREQTAFIRCIAVDEPADTVAQALGTTSNAVNLLVYKAKRKLRSCLRRAGVDVDDLQLFEPV
jgi:RNA polymerase sigma factor (sigma-70 family)